MVHLQEVLEGACFAYGRRNLAGILRERGWDCVESVPLTTWMNEPATARKNPLLWWTSILVRSEISDDGEKDFISGGTISMNMFPPDVDIKGRIEGIRHYGKVFILDKAFIGWRAGRPGCEDWAEEIAQDLNEVDNEWLNKEDGQRPDDRLDRRTCQSTAWERLMHSSLCSINHCTSEKMCIFRPGARESDAHARMG